MEISLYIHSVNQAVNDPLQYQYLSLVYQKSVSVVEGVTDKGHEGLKYLHLGFWSYSISDKTLVKFIMEINFWFVYFHER